MKTHLLLWCCMFVPFAQPQSRVCNSVADARNNKCLTHTQPQCSNVITNCPIGTYVYCETYNNAKLIACIACPTSCPTGQYLGVSCPSFPQFGNSYPQCTDCTIPVAPCSTGQYIGGCAQNINYQCTACPVCPANHYLVGCNTYAHSPGTCTVCSNCSQDYTASGGCVGSQDRFCTGGFCNAATKCSNLVCNFIVRRVPNCNSAWFDIPLTVPDPFNFLCLESTANGTCQLCPPGWRKQGDYCTPCPEGFSCDSLGNIKCKGECDIWFWPTCNNGYVVCSPCAQHGSNISNSIVTRSGIADSPDYCSAYIQCRRGYFLSFESFNHITCAPCLIPEANASQWQFASYGVTFGDNYSCMYEPLTTNVSDNDLGFYGSKSTQQFSCDVAFTSVAGFASVRSHCIACDNAPLNAFYDIFVKDCSFTCINGEKRGMACVPSTCPDCITHALPWNKPGYEIPSTRSLLISQHSLPIYTLSASGDFTVNYDYIYKNNDNTTFCDNIPNGQSMEQDVPLTCSTCYPTSKLNYNYYRVYTNPASPFVFFFLERAFGYNNRYILWKVFKNADTNQEGSVQAHWKLPGRVCSASTTYNNQKEIMFLTLCNTSWVSWIDVSSPAQVGLTKAVIQSNIQYIGRKINRLIGQDFVGNQDGLRQVALFNKKLWTAALNAMPSRVFVADEINCRLVEIHVSETNEALHYAQTIGKASCYDTLIGLFFPRLLTPTTTGNFLLFLSNKGIHQVNMQTRNTQLLITPEYLPGNITSIESDETFIKIYNHTVMYNFSLDSTACPDGFVAASGTRCTPCPQNTYTADHIQCLPCSPLLSCGQNFSLKQCTFSADASCSPCPPLPANQIYFLPNSCGQEAVAFLPPCPAGYQRDSANTYCTLCPMFATSDPVSQTCTCYGNGTLDALAFQCRNVSTVFNNQQQDQIIPNWFSPLDLKCAIDECPTFSCYLASISPKQCLPCPIHTVSKNNLWCYPCPLHEQPNIYQDYCVCTHPRIRPADNHSCVCPSGYYTSEHDSSCIQCPAHSIQPLLNMSACSLCPDGFIANDARTACVPCPVGTFRVGPDSLDCAACPTNNSFAPSASETTCVSCTQQCAHNFLWNPCPARNSSNAFFHCTSCPAPPTNAHLVTSRSNTQCHWECNPNFFFNISSKTCTQCSSPTCQAGVLPSQCTVYQDSQCVVPCTNTTMPAFNAFYFAQCEWACMQGYVLSKKQIFGQTVYSCVI
jgi:hypothetical protein